MSFCSQISHFFLLTLHLCCIGFLFISAWSFYLRLRKWVLPRMKSATYLITISKINTQSKTNKRQITNVSNVLAMPILKVHWQQVHSCWCLISHYLHLFQIAILRFSILSIALIPRARHLKPLKFNHYTANSPTRLLVLIVLSF